LHCRRPRFLIVAEKVAFSARSIFRREKWQSSQRVDGRSYLPGSLVGVVRRAVDYFEAKVARGCRF